jgi:hypothetical protein
MYRVVALLQQLADNKTDTPKGLTQGDFYNINNDNSQLVEKT